MAFDVVMFGTLNVPERNLEEWLTTPSDPNVFPWLEEVGGTEVNLETPEGFIAYLSELSLLPHEFLEVSQLEGQVVVRAFVSDDTWRDAAQVVAQLFASAAAFGGHGQLTLTGYQGIRFGEQITVEKGAATFTALAHQTLSQVEQQPAFKAIDQRIHEKFDGLVGRPGAPMDARRSKWVVHPFTGRKVKALADA